MFSTLLASLLLMSPTPKIYKKPGEIYVLVVDTGIAKHPALTSVVYEDTNAYVDNHGHGTHIAGLIQNGDGDSKVCPQVKILSCKYFEPGKPADSFTYCLKMAKALNVDYVNVSGGGSEFISDEYEAFKAYKGIVYAAAGNEKLELTDKYHYFPASYSYAKIQYGKGRVTEPLNNIKVIQSVCNNVRAKYSNYRMNSLQECGSNKISTHVNNGYAMLSGTSQATALALNKELVKRCSTLTGGKYGQK